MKKVLQVLGSLERGGAETMVMNIYRNIDKEQIQFDFIVREKKENSYEKEVKEMGANIFYIESPKKIGLIKCIKEHINVMKKNGPYTAVHSHINALSFISLIAAKIAKIKVRISHSHSTRFPGKIKSFLGKVLIKIFATDLVGCGNLAGKALFGRKKFVLMPNGIDTKRFLPTSKKEKDILQQKLKMKKDVIHICHIGRFVEVKNHNFIIEIAKNLKKENVNFEINLLGDGEKYNEIKELVKINELEKNINLHGSISNVSEFLKASDLLILPSLYEGLPVTIVEAQCAGLPCAISDRVTKDVDCDLGLVKYLPLEVEKWTNYIKEQRYKQEFNNKKILKAITDNHYNIEESVRVISEIYTK